MIHSVKWFNHVIITTQNQCKVIITDLKIEYEKSCNDTNLGRRIALINKPRILHLLENIVTGTTNYQ